MRILQINNCHYNRGGADNIYLNTGRVLKEKGHTVAYFSVKDERNIPNDYEEFFVSNIPLRKVNFLQKIKKAPSYIFNKEAFNNISKLIQEFKPDIAHVHLYYGSLSISILEALRKLNIPVVHSIHDYRLICPVNTFLDRKSQICEKCKDKNYFHAIKNRCSDGNFFQSAILSAEAYFWKFKSKPVSLINHFIFTSQFAWDKHIEFNPIYKTNSSLLYNCPIINNNKFPINRGNYYLYYGRLSVEKGIGTLIKAFINNKEKLVIAGNGPLAAEVKGFAEKYENISYVGFQTGQALQDLVLNSSFVIVPSEWYENNPMTIIEAFTLGKPVIGAKIGGIPELVINGETGFLFESRNFESLQEAIIKTAATTDDEYKFFTSKIFEFTNKLIDVESHYNALINIYNKVLPQ